MPQYVVMFPADDEAGWEAGTESDHQATYDVDNEFIQALTGIGGAVTGGAGLAHSRTARTITRGPGSTTSVAHGPSTDSHGQLSGFFIVTCDDYDALVETARVLVRAHPVVEIRAGEES